jgi:hypothetical protein
VEPQARSLIRKIVFHLMQIFKKDLLVIYFCFLK